MKYAAIINDSIHHEGDERSRTHPGHGYPAWTESVKKFQPFKDKADMLKFVERQSRYSSSYQLIEYNELKVNTKVEVSVSPENTPANCRNKLQKEGKLYPRSSCQVCGSLIRPDFKCPYGE